MSWADRAIEVLTLWDTAVIFPRGNSMEPLIKSGQRVELEPVLIEDLKKGDIVLCKVKGRVYLHLVKAKRKGQVLIGNNRGHTNGWTSTVYGIATRIT